MRIKFFALLVFAVFAVGCSQSPSGTANNGSNASRSEASDPNATSKSAASPSNAPASAASQNKGPFPDVPRIAIADAKKDFDSGNVVFIDTHSKSMYNNEHIKGAINIPFNEMEAHMDLVPKGKKIITYCSCPAENTSAAVGHELIKKGFTNVYALIGGNNAWKTAGYPMEKAAK